jgi:hypothetical protein
MVFENRVLRKIFGPMRDEVRAEWRRLHNKEMGKACGRHGRREVCIWFWWEDLGEKDHFEGLSVNGRII